MMKGRKYCESNVSFSRRIGMISRNHRNFNKSVASDFVDMHKRRN